jgi:hypothetical protein
LIDLAQAPLVESERTGRKTNGSKETQEDQTGKESPKSDESTAAQKNQQVRQIKSAKEIAGQCRGANYRDASSRVARLARFGFLRTRLASLQGLLKILHLSEFLMPIFYAQGFGYTFALTCGCCSTYPQTYQQVSEAS